MSITASNANVFLTIADLFPTPQQLQQFSADDVFGTEALTNAEVQMGVDGALTAGFVHNPVMQSFSLMADSPSNFFFDQWFLQERVQNEKLIASGLIELRSIGTKWSMVRGYLTSYQPIPDAKKVLQFRKHTVTWQRITPSPV